MSNDWRPMSEAPRDGTEILAYDEQLGMQVVEYAWNDRNERPLFHVPGLPARYYQRWRTLPEPPHLRGQIEEAQSADEVSAAHASAGLTPIEAAIKAAEEKVTP
jgi:hypothetical protein